jgi:DNA-binding XRE family transcriptional regulator
MLSCVRFFVGEIHGNLSETWKEGMQGSSGVWSGVLGSGNYASFCECDVGIQVHMHLGTTENWICIRINFSQVGFPDGIERYVRSLMPVNIITVQFALQAELSWVPNESCQIDPIERRVVLLLRDARLKDGISATQLAAKIGISRASISHIEANRARPGFWMLYRISEGLGVDLAEFINQARKL